MEKNKEVKKKKIQYSTKKKSVQKSKGISRDKLPKKKPDQA